MASDRQPTTSGGSAQRSPLVAFYASRVTPHLPLGLALVWALVAALPLFADPGFLNTRGIGDSPNLLFRVHQLLAALASGEFPARWMLDAAYSYGQPYFTYYASFSTHIAALLKLYGFSYVHAIKLTQLLALLVAAGGMHGWLRAVRLTPAQAGLGAAAYTFAPFHLVNLYVRGDSLAELWAMALYPSVLWAAQLCLDSLTFRRAFALALAVAVLVCTHNISALNFLPFVGLYVLLSAWQLESGKVEGRKAPHARLILLATLYALLLWGLTLSAFFWLPALRESEFVQLGDLTGGFFFYGNHFRSTDLFNAALLFNYATNPFSLGLLQAALAALGLAVMVWQAWRARVWPWLNTFLLAGLALSLFMVTPLSRPLWDALPLVTFTQFPWRFLSIAALFTAALTARFWILDSGFSMARRHPLLLSTLYFLFPAVLALSAILPLKLEFFPLADSDVTAARLNLYEYFTTAIGNTVNSEYLPREVEPRPFTSDSVLGRAPRLKVLSGQAEGERMWKHGAAEQWAVTVRGDTNATVAVPTHDWPGWQAEADGQPLAVRAAPGLGWLTVDLPPGAHTVTFHLGRTPLRLTSEVFSLVSLAVPLAAFLYHRAHREHGVRLSPVHPLARSPFHLVTLALLVIGFLALRSTPHPPLSTLPLNADFNALSYFHHDAVRFADGTQLISARYDRDRLRPGETFTLTTEWRTARPGQARFVLVSPATRVAGIPPLYLTGPGAADLSGVNPLATQIVIPPHIAPGVYFVAVELIAEQGVVPALTSAGRARGLVHLAPLWVERDLQAETASPLQSFLGFDLLTTKAQQDRESLRLDLRWRANADLPLNYVLALRVRDADGNEIAGLDTQPGHGFYPTALWRPGEAVPDSLRLPLPAGLPPAAYTASITPYNPLTLAPLGTATLSTTLSLPLPPVAAPHWPVTPELALDRVEIPAQAITGEPLTLVAHWVTTAAPTDNLRARWTLTGADKTYAETVPLAPGSAPRDWAAEAQYMGRARLALPGDLMPGAYTLSVQLVREDGESAGNPANVGTVEIVGRARDFALPPVQTEVGATFDGQLKLAGYDAARTANALTLTLVWQALAAPRGDYKYFVHLFNPADEAIAAQVDAVPRAFMYPTTLWVKDEVVTETVALSLTGVPPGTYRLAVGWYDPATPDLARLPAFDAQGQALANGRVVLPLEIKTED